MIITKTTVQRLIQTIFVITNTFSSQTSVGIRIPRYLEFIWLLTNDSSMIFYYAED